MREQKLCCQLYGKKCAQTVWFIPIAYSCDVLDVVGFKHHRINHSEAFSKDGNHINGIENLWIQAKRHLRKFNGIPKEHFELYLKECEWRFNYTCPKMQLQMLKRLISGTLR